VKFKELVLEAWKILEAREDAGGKLTDAEECLLAFCEVTAEAGLRHSVSRDEAFLAGKEFAYYDVLEEIRDADIEGDSLLAFLNTRHGAADAAAMAKRHQLRTMFRHD
jgi:hypothetical protein